MAKLIIKPKNGQQRELNLVKEVFTMGRMPENDLEIASPLASRKHAELIRKGNVFTLYDLGSSNGTMVNGEKINVRKLNGGETLIIGDTTMEFVADSEVSEEFPENDATQDIQAAAAKTPPKTQTKAKTPLPQPNEIIRSMKELSGSFDLNLSQSVSRGVSLKEIGKEKASKTDAEKYFILYQLSREIAPTKGLDEVLDITMSFIFQIINAERGVITLYDTETGTLVPKIAKHRTKGNIHPSELTVSSTIMNKSLFEQVAIISSDAKEDPRFKAGASIAQYNIRSALCVPLWDRDVAFGVIYLDSMAGARAFESADLELLTAIANVVAIRIRQDQLYEQLRVEATKRQNLERYHPPEVVNLILARGENELLSAQERVCTVLFADIVGFTRLSEQLKPQQISQMLNKYFGLATRATFENNGTVNKFIGDCVMATFGAPVYREEHAKNAVNAAIQIMNGLREIQNDGRTYSVRIGINSGDVVAGNIGSEHLIEYTVLGDTVNLAKRFEESAEPGTAFMGELTNKLLNGTVPTRDMGLIKVKGKDQPVRAFRII